LRLGGVETRQAASGWRGVDMPFYLRLALVLGLTFNAAARAHPVPVNSYDRTIVVRLTPSAVVVEYILEVDSFTARNDVPSLVSRAELARIGNPEQVHEAFARASAPLLANNLLARFGGRALTFSCTRRTYKVLDHLRCEYRFEAPWKIEPNRPAAFTFREVNYDDEPGTIRLSLEADPALRLSKVTQPNEALKTRPLIDLRPGDVAKLRSVSASFEFYTGTFKAGAISTAQGKPAATGSAVEVKGPPSDFDYAGTDKPATPYPVLPPTPVQEAPPKQQSASATDPVENEKPPSRWSLHDLLFASERGLWALLAFAAFLGAVHALTPGHGKTLVAAYLVGQQGTVGHAIFLGLVTALTHTGAVLLVAGLLPLIFPNVEPSDMQQLLGFIGGLLIAFLGFWLLQRRLAGKADHFHIGGGHHHHHHDDEDHHHHEPGEPLRLKDLVMLGISGGIVPCGEALALFILAIRWERLEWAFWLLLAFSVGLALVLVAVGISVVYAQRFALSRWKGSSKSRLVRLLPIGSAILITLIGVWLCYDSVHTAHH
jgi:ABC-type nickel/cobalt efflux system permease component RcnA